jgi:septal ring factor EnvC (AmiA/AmiB activator)
MKKLWKYIVGFFTFVVGILLLSGRKNKKVKELKKDIKKVNTSIKNRQKKIDNIDKSLASKKKALDEIKKSKFKKKDVGAKEASDFLKDFSKKK